MVGCLEYDDKRDKICAYLKEGAQGNPRGLFGIFETDSIVSDRRVRAYFEDCVVPKTHQNIDDILKYAGIPYYDQWAIYKHNNGRNQSDYASIRFREMLDSDHFVDPFA